MRVSSHACAVSVQRLQAAAFILAAHRSTVALPISPTCTRRRTQGFVRRTAPNYSFNATVTCRADNPAPSAAR